MKAKKKRPDPRACRVIISVSGGVADVMFKPRGVEVCLYDYDVEGAEEDRVDHDPDGEPCSIGNWPAREIVSSNTGWPIVRSAVRQIIVLPRQDRWQCPKCRRIVLCSKQSLAEAGTPYCADCDRHMQML